MSARTIGWIVGSVIMTATFMTVVARPVWSQAPWPEGTTSAEPHATRSPLMAQLPSDVEVTAPSQEVPEELARFSGIWSGGVCRDWRCSVRVAVEKLHANGATFVYAFAAPRQAWRVRLNGKWENKELTAKTEDGWTIVLRLREKTDIMETIGYVSPKRFFAGVIAKE